MASFASDNAACAHPAVLAALAAANDGFAPAYGGDAVTAAMREAFRAAFEAPDAQVWPVFNGSACNGLALAAMIRPYESVLAHRIAHIHNDECGLPEFFTGGKIVALDGADGKLTPDGVAGLVAAALNHAPHTARPRALSLTQSTELGTVYTPDEVRALCETAHAHGLYVHMDGARLANAAAALGCRPAQITSKAGVDALSFGATKNGALAAEAVVIFNPELARDFPYIHKRGGQLPSKARFISAQLLALLQAGLWLDLARRAARMAQALRDGLAALPGVRLLHPVEANALVVHLPRPVAERLTHAGHRFYPWPASGPDAYRLVTSFQTTDADVAAFLRDAHV